MTAPDMRLRSTLRPLLLAAALTGCVAAPRLAHAPVPAAPGPHFDVMRFFAGRSVGEGRLSRIFSRPEAVRVESSGRVEGGVLHLVQTVRLGARPARIRSWAIREVGPGRYAGALTDAVGEFRAETRGNRLHLRYAMRGGLAVEQWLTLSPDGRRASNLMRIRALGLVVAILAEDIRRID